MNSTNQHIIPNTAATQNFSQQCQSSNHLGSASLELDHNADIISYEEYHSFGTTSYRSGRTETEVSLKRYKYVGKERDEETGLYYYGARYYAAWIARFVSVDSLQFEYPQLTPYNYAGNKPVTHIDIDGMQGTGDEKIINTNYIPSPIVNDKTNYVNPYKIHHQADKSQSSRKVMSPEIRNIQGRIESFSKALKSGVDLSQAILQDAKNKYITDVVGDLYLKQGDVRLKVSKNRILNPDDIPFNKMTSRYTRMTDDLSRTHKLFRNIGRGMDAAFFIYDIFKYVSSDSFQEKGTATYDLGMDVLSLGSGYIHPALGAVIGFGDMVMSSSDFKNQMLNYYKGEMDKYKHNNSSKFKNAEDNYYKYYKQIHGNRSENAQDKQLYFNSKQ